VVNSFNEYVGIVTLSDILNRLLGEAEKSFEEHDDRKAVASRHSQPEPTVEPSAAAEIVPTDSSEMVE
jgi:CBS domain containing-hemolysin-like protein